MRLPFISRRYAQAAVAAATAGLRADLEATKAELAAERADRRKAEHRAAQLDQRLYEMQLATELHDQQLHAKEADS
ncbi:hypothetical protein ABZ135_38525 [Streptomyces sp. NPDC006339]|uniref:hypothetical protein n=1 Tax=Streptomyces sp. NPDC006339 TaxID=3156755 RepID=UPI0033AA7D77